MILSGTVAAGDTVDLYGLDPCNPCAFPQGKTYLGEAIANASGVWTYNASGSGITDPQGITATNTQKATGSTSQFSTCTTLPVHLSYFNATLAGTDVLLTWATASEDNNDRFLIERSTDGIHFEIIGTVAGAGNSTQLIQYSFIDAEALSGVSYYRLKQIDYDGAFEYSRIRSVNTNSGHTVSIYPNPVQTGDGISIRIAGLSGEELVSIQVVNAIGQSILAVSGYTNEYTFTETQLAAGVYLFHIRIGNENSVEKVIVY